MEGGAGFTKRFNRCVKSVRKTVKARKGSTKESAAIGICVKTVLHRRGRTMKSYRKGRLTTQKKLRGGVAGIAAKVRAEARKLAKKEKKPLDEISPFERFTVLSKIPGYKRALEAREDDKKEKELYDAFNETYQKVYASLKK